MQLSSDPSRRSPTRRLALLSLVFVAAILSCGKDVTGPLGAAARYVRGLSWDAIFPPAFQQAGSASGNLVPFTSVHVVLHHSDGTVALDTTINFPSDSTSYTADLTVKLLDGAPTAGEPMTLSLGYLNAAGDTVFKGGPVAVTAAPPPPGGGANPPVQVPVQYTGPGASAVGVQISPRAGAALSGGSFTFTAVAVDASGNTVPNTPLVWSSLNPSIASVASATSGTVVAGATRGTATIVAQLLTGPSDQVSFSVSLPASQMVASGGNGQSGVVGATLAQALSVKVAASDGVGVAGVPVSFSVASGGGSVSSGSATSDANGNASTSWKLGTTVGAQSVTASAGGLSGSPITFGATATAAVATKLVVSGSPGNGVAGAVLSSVVVTAQDANGNTATTFTGSVSVGLSGGTAGAALGGTSTVNAVAGVATFSGLTVNKVGTGYSLSAASSGLTGASTGSFDIIAGPAAVLVFTGQPSAAIPNASIGTIVVNAQDAQGNPTPAFTGTVSLSLASNPGSATLGGGTSVAAVAGIATFTGVTVSQPGVGYALSASSGSLTGATSAAFNIAGGPASVLTLVSGNGQSGATGVALAQPVVLRVTNASGGGVSGTTVNFAIVTGGGSVAPTSAVSDATGQVSTVWTLGATVGPQSISATSTGLSGSPATINATGTAAGATQLVFTAQPSNGTAGSTISPAIVVTAKDALNNVATTYSGNVTLAFGANPGGSILGGTLTVAAVSGVATFNTVLLSKAAAGYTLVATSGALTSATSSTFNMVAGPASTLAISGGQAQTGNTSAALPTPLAVTIQDANGNAVSGVNVNWTTSGGATMSPTTSATNAAGVATSTWTLGTTPGAQTATATSGTLTGSPATFNATATLAAFSKTWTGATSTAWNTSTNWTPVGVPAATDSVFIPSGGNQPTISSAVTLKNLQIGFSATLLVVSSPTITINGSFTNNGSMGGSGTMALAGTGSVGGIVSTDVTVTGTYSASAAVTLAGNLSVSGSLDLNGQNVIVPAAFSTSGTGTIKMASASALTVFGNATFGGGSETGLITNGLITVKGNFTQSGATTSFVATGSNAVSLLGTTAQTLSITTPAMSTFENLTASNAAGVTINTNVTISNNLVVSTGTVSAVGSTLTIGGTLADPSAGLTASNIIFNGVSTPIGAPTVNANVTFNANPTQMGVNVVINGNVVVGGNLQLNTHYLTVNGSFTTLNSGQLTMTNASDSMYVSGNTQFGGGIEAGILTNGKLKLNGNFSQINNGNAQEFKAVAGHQTVLVGSGAQTISFANPDTLSTVCAFSCFGDFTVTKTAGTVSFGSSAGMNGSVTVNTGVTAVTAIGTSGGGPRFILVRGATTTNASTGVHVTRFGSFGAAALDPSTEADTLQFHGTSAQTIPSAVYPVVIIKGSPTVAAGGFSTTADLIVDGGNLTLGGNGVVVGARFITTGVGTLTMTNAADSLFVTDSARFSGGAETGLLTNGALLIYKSLTVGSGSAQFAATGSHMTYLVGTNAVGCNTCDIHDTRARHMTRAQYQASVAARSAARAPLVAMLMPRAAAIQAAVAAKGAPTKAVVLTPAQQQQRARQFGGTVKSAAHLPLTPTTSNLIAVSFATTTGNSFGNVRILGGVDWQTPANVVNNLDFDPTHGGTLAGNGHATVGNAFAGPKDSSSVAIEALELAGTGGGSFADLGYFSPDTTIWSGTNQQMAGDAGGRFIDWYNVVVNSSTLFAFDDSVTISVGASLFITNSGQLNLGRNTDPTEMNVNGSFETHQLGTLRMDNNASSQLDVSDSAWFDGGSSTGLLTQGQIYFGGNFRQTATNSTSSYSAVTPHQSYFAGYWGGADTISFANPSNTLSHFGDFYLAAQTSVLMSDVYAVGQLQTGNGTGSFMLHAATDRLVTSNGSNIRGLTFDNVRWKTAGTDGNGLFPSLDDVTFQNISATTMPQFDYEYSVKTNIPNGSNPASLAGITFSTTPTGAGVYIKVVGPDTLTMSSPTPALNGGFISVSGGGAVNGWPSSVVANWIGVNTIWTNTANWSTGLVPDASTDVTITCDCSAPATSGAQAVHSLTMSGTGEQLSLGGPFTVNGDLSIAALSNILVGSNNLTLLGNVYMDTTAAFSGITCNAGNRSTGATIAGTGTHNVRGKFCALTVGGTYLATGPILIKHTTGGDANLTIQSGGSLDLNGHRVDTDSMYTTGGGTFTMQHSADSLVLHNVNAGIPVSFNGGSETGLITNGTIVDRSPGFRANGTAFDASGSNILVADSAAYQDFHFIGGSAGHGLNNVILKNSNKSFSSTLYISGTLTLDVSMTTSGAFQATANYLYVNQVIDNTGNTNGGLSGAYWVHLTGGGTLPAVLGVDSLFVETGGNMSLTQNVSANVVVVQDNAGPTGLILAGHTLKTNNFNFITNGTSFVQMTSAGDSLALGTGSVYFNGGGYSSILTAGGIAAGGFYQGYSSTSTTAPSTAANSYNPSGTHRLWLTQNAPIIFANPGTGTSLSHFNTLRNPSGYTSTLYSNVFVDDSIYFATSGTAIFNSNTLSSAATTRLITTKGLADNTISTGIEFGNVTLKFVDGQAAPTTFSNIQWTGFPLFGGNAFEIARTSGSPITNMTNYDFSALGVLGLLGGGHLVANTGTVAGWSFSSVNAGLLSILTSFTLNAGNVFP